MIFISLIPVRGISKIENAWRLGGKRGTQRGTVPKDKCREIRCQKRNATARRCSAKKLIQRSTVPKQKCRETRCQKRNAKGHGTER